MFLFHMLVSLSLSPPIPLSLIFVKSIKIPLGKNLKKKRRRKKIPFLTRAHLPSLPGLRIKETKEVYEGEVTELTPCETENPMGGYGKTISHVIIGLKTAKGTKQLKVSMFMDSSLASESLSTMCGLG